MFNCILSGVGGQGTILASKLIAQAAMDNGMFARTAETIGMAQRGGSVVSHVRIGETIFSPLIPKQMADILIGFEPSEAVRNLAYLKKNGTIVVSKNAIKPVTTTLADNNYSGEEMISFLSENVRNVIIVDSENICLICGSAKVLNVALLGAAAASGALGLTIAELEKTIKTMLPERFIEMNLKALHLGGTLQ